MEKRTQQRTTIQRWTPKKYCGIKCRNQAANEFSRAKSFGRKQAVIDVPIKRGELGAGN